MSEDEKFFDDDEGLQPFSESDLPPKRELVTYPYDPPVKTLVKEIEDKDLIVNPEFQRQSVWDRGRKSRLVESLLLNIPIPVCFFAEDEDGRKVVVDGQQRLRAIEEFIHGQFRLYGLQVLPELNNKRWTDLSTRQARIIENRVIRCIVISEASHPSIRFEVFERLNTGVVPLTDQELRNCVYRGPLNRKLEDLVHDPYWLETIRKKAPDNRLRHHELVLRFLAFRYHLPEYRPPLKQFLNDFMRAQRAADTETLQQFEEDFRSAVRNVHQVFGRNAFRRANETKSGSIRWDNTINRAVFDIQMYGLQHLTIEQAEQKKDQIQRKFLRLCEDDEQFADAIAKATADRTKVMRRFRRFGAALTDIDISAPWLSKLPAE